MRCKHQFPQNYHTTNLNLSNCYRNWEYTFNNCSSQQCQNICSLSLNNCQINQSTIDTIFIKNCPKLQDLNLQQNNLKNKGLQKILKHFPQIQCLKLGNCQIDCQTSIDGIAPMLDIKYQNLKILKLWGNNIGIVGCKILSKVQFLLLESLHIGACNIRSQGLKHLTKSRFKTLFSLIIYYNHINLDGYESIKHAGWSSLKYLQLKQYQPPIIYLSIIPIQADIMQPAKRQKWIRGQLLKYQFYRIFDERFR